MDQMIHARFSGMEYLSMELGTAAQPTPATGRPTAVMAFSLRTAFIAAAVLGAATVCAAAAAPATGRPAPPFTLRTLDGETLRLESFHGRTLVINVWGSWCPPCRLETPDLIAEANAMRAKGVAFLGVDTTETAPVVRAFSAAKGIPYPQVATTSRSDFARDYGITNYPTTIVIDPNGIVRAIHADNILPRTQLNAYIVAAQQGRTAPLVSAEQQKLDAMLAPGQFPFDGDPATVLANVRAAQKAIEAADDELDDAMIDPARDHDLLQTHAEQAALRARAIVALQANAQAPADKVLLARLQGDQAVAERRYADAVTSYDNALALDQRDRGALSGLAYALSKTGDDAGVVKTDRRIVALEPSYTSEIALARASAAAGDLDGTLAAIDAALPLAAQRSPVALAWAHLYAGRAAIQVHDPARARTEFLAAQAAAERVPRDNPRYAWYLEQSQEALLALGLTGAQPATNVTIAPWTGPELPGSIASTYKYRVALSGPPGKAATLRASGLPKYWIASFCTDRVCSPFTVRTMIPPSGVKIIEFQVIPDGPDLKAHPTVRIDAVAGGLKTSTSTTVSYWLPLGGGGRSAGGFGFGGDAFRHIAEDERVERRDPVPIQVAEDSAWLEEGGLAQRRAARGIGQCFELKPGFAGQPHLGAQAEQAVRLPGFDAPEVHGVADAQVVGRASPATHAEPAGQAIQRAAQFPQRVAVQPAVRPAQP
jgi:peroxiredoxin